MVLVLATALARASRAYLLLVSAVACYRRVRAKLGYLVIIGVGVTFVIAAFDEGELVIGVDCVFHGRWIEEVVPVALSFAASYHFKVSRKVSVSLYLPLQLHLLHLFLIEATCRISLEGAWELCRWLAVRYNSMQLGEALIRH